MLWQQILTGWEPILFLTSLIVIIIYGLFYALGIAFNKFEWQRVAKAELIQQIVVIFLILFFVDSFSLVFNYLQQSIHGTLYCALGTSYTYAEGNLLDAVKCKLSEKASALANMYESLRAEADPVFNAFYENWGLLGGAILHYQGVTSSILSNNPQISELYWKMENIRLLTSTITSLLIGINAYIFMIDYFKVMLMNLFLPLGIILRTIPFTRNLGSLLISSAIGFYIVFPTLYFITDPGISFLSSINIFSYQQAQQSVASLYYFFLAQPLVLFSITLIFIRYLNTLLGGENQELFVVMSKVI